MAERAHRTSARAQADETVEEGEPIEGTVEERPDNAEPGERIGDGGMVESEDAVEKDPNGAPPDVLEQAHLTKVAEVPEGFERLPDGTLRADDAPDDPTRQ